MLRTGLPQPLYEAIIFCTSTHVIQSIRITLLDIFRKCKNTFVAVYGLNFLKNFIIKTHPFFYEIFSYVELFQVFKTVSFETYLSHAFESDLFYYSYYSPFLSIRRIPLCCNPKTLRLYHAC